MRGVPWVGRWILLPGILFSPASPQEPGDDGTDEILFVRETKEQYDLSLIGPKGGQGKAVSGHPKDDTYPSWSPDGQRIAFTSDRDGNPDIYILDVRSGRTERLTDHPAGDYAPIWSPRGDQLAFLSDRDGCLTIHVMDVKGQRLRRLTSEKTPEWSGMWSPDGSRIAFVKEKMAKDKGTHVWVVASDGSSARALAEGDSPRWSPDGSRIAFTKPYGPSIWMMNADGSGARRFPRLPGKLPDHPEPAWSPDGRRIAICLLPPGEKQYQLYSVDEGGVAWSRLARTPGEHRSPSWSPDGTRVAFLCANPQTRLVELAVARADGSGARALTDEAVPRGTPRWRPSPARKPAPQALLPARPESDVEIREAGKAPSPPPGMTGAGPCYRITGAARHATIRLPLPEPDLARDPSKEFFIGRHDGKTWTLHAAEPRGAWLQATVDRCSVFTILWKRRRGAPTDEELPRLRIGRPQCTSILLDGDTAVALVDISDCRTAYAAGSEGDGVRVAGLKVHVAVPTGARRIARPGDLQPYRYRGTGEDVVLDVTPGTKGVLLEFDPDAVMKINVEDNLEKCYAWYLALQPVFSNGTEGPLSEPVQILAGAAEACLKLRAGIAARLGPQTRAAFLEGTEQDLYLHFAAWIGREAYVTPDEGMRTWLAAVLGGGGAGRYIGLTKQSEYSRVVSHEWGHYVANLVYGDDAFFRFPGGKHAGWKEAASRELAWSEDLATFFGQYGSGRGFPDDAGPMAGRWSDHSRHPEDFEEQGALDNLWPRNRKLDAARVEGIGATILSRLAQLTSFEEVWKLLQSSRPGNLLEFCEAWIKTGPEERVEQLQKTCIVEGITWPAEGRVVGWLQKEGEEMKPLEGAEVRLLSIRDSSLDSYPATDAKGRFSFRLPPGPLRLKATKTDWRQEGKKEIRISTQESTLEKPQPLTDLVMRPARWNLVFCEGKPAEGIRLFRMDESGGGRVQIGSLPKGWGPVAWSPNAARLLVLGGSESGGPSNLAVFTPAGSALRALTAVSPPRRDSEGVETDETVMDPVWSPDGQRVAYLNLLRGGGKHRYSLCVTDAGESDRTVRLWEGKVGEEEAKGPLSWSPDGKEICFTRGDRKKHEWVENYDLWSAKSDGSGCRSLVAGPKNELLPVWSPDGSRIAFLRPEGSGLITLWLCDVAGRSVSRVTDGLLMRGVPAWSPDGTKMVVTLRHKPAGEWVDPLMMLNDVGQELWRAPLPKHTSFLTSPQWSPDGRYCAVVTDPVNRTLRDQLSALYLLDADGTNLRSLGRAPAPIAWTRE